MLTAIGVCYQQLPSDGQDGTQRDCLQEQRSLLIRHSARLGWLEVAGCRASGRIALW
jgi:hypothetical protein